MRFHYIEFETDITSISKTVWRFYYNESISKLVLDVVKYQIRQTTRHKFVNANYWSRCEGRQCTIEKPDVLYGVKEIAKTLWIKQIENSVDVE